MSTNSAIEWTEATWNPVAGCTPVSPGCLHCYAATMSHRLEGMGQEKYRGLTVLRNGVRTFNGKISFDEKALTIPLKRKVPTMYFVNSMSDLFHEGVSDKFIDKVFAVMALSPQHTFQILTKRPERMAAYLSYDNGNPIDIRIANAAFDLRGWQRPDPVAVLADLPGDLSWPLGNVWLGTSVENQEQADKRVPHLLRCPAAVRFLSCEPLLSEIDLHKAFACAYCEGPEADYHTSCLPPSVGWVIVGGESGVGARPMHVEWARSIVAQCQAAGVMCFVKQLGAKVLWDGMQGGYGDGPSNVWPPGMKRTDFAGNWRVWLRDGKGGDPSEWPADLRVRQFPNATEVSHA